MVTHSTDKLRSYEIDCLRGFAIVLMVIFHFGYDLTVFGWASYNTGADIEWRVFRSIIVSGFLLAVGMSSFLAYHQTINWVKLIKSVGKLASVAGLLTLGSLFMHPNAWVYFGIIHFIAIALPISVLFVRIPKVALWAGIICIVGYWLELFSLYPLWEWSVHNIGIPNRTVDLVSFIPWIGVVLIGIYLMSKNLFNLRLSPRKSLSTLAFFGKHSLLIYLIHQPILYAILGSIKWLVEV